MPLTKEQRIEYLKKAREAKAIKAKKIKKLNITTEIKKQSPNIEIEEDKNIEVVEEIKKIKKPKTIIKKIIKEEYETDTDEEIIEIFEPPKYKTSSKSKKIIKNDKENITASLFNY